MPAPQQLRQPMWHMCYANQCGICALKLLLHATPAQEMNLQRQAIRLLLTHPKPIVTFESRILFDSYLVADAQVASQPLPSLWKPWSRVVQPAETPQKFQQLPLQQLPLPRDAQSGPAPTTSDSVSTDGSAWATMRGPESNEQRATRIALAEQTAPAPRARLVHKMAPVNVAPTACIPP